MTKAIITVVGKDNTGIIAKVCTYLAESNVNILDITQTIVKGFFNMMMIVNVENSPKSFDQLSTDPAGRGDWRADQDTAGGDIQPDAQNLNKVEAER